MKELKSKRYIRKEAIWSLPGNSNLPPGVTEEMIREQGEGPVNNISTNKKGESEIEINWQEFSQWFQEGGEQLPGDLSNRINNSPVWIEYIYDYDHNAGKSINIKAVQLKDYVTNQLITDEYILNSFIEYYEEKIKNDIKVLEEGSKIER